MARGMRVAAVAALVVVGLGFAVFRLLEDPPGGLPAPGVGGGATVARGAPEPATRRTTELPAEPGRIRSNPFDPAAAVGEIVVVGSVFDEAGVPVAGARVSLHADASRSLAQMSEGALVAEVSTGENGAFQFDDPTRLKPRDRYLLRVAHPEFVVERIGPVDPASPATLRRDVMLRRRGGGLAGLVADEYGAPLPAVVQVYDAAASSTDFLGALEKEGRADAAGRYRLGALKPGFKTIRVSAEGYTTAARADFEVREGVVAELEFRLARGRSVAGNVVGKDTGRGVAGATVVARLLRLDGQRAVDPADAEKHAAELARLAAQQREEAAARATKRTENGETEAEAEPTLPEDELRRQRAQWATLRKAPPGVAITDADGAFEIRGLEDGAYEITVKATGYQAPPAQGVTVGEAVLFELDRNGALRGRCVDAETGAPIPAFTLGLSAGPDQKFVASATKRTFGGATAADGAFEYADVGPGRWQLVAEAPGYAGGRSDVVTLALGEIREGLVVRLERGCEVRGLVTDAKGAPLAGAPVRLEPANLAAHPLAAVMMRQVRRDVVTARAGADGRYVFPAVLAGEYVVETVEGDFAPARTTPFNAPATGVCEAPTLRAPAGGTITGRVVRKADGAPDAAATVRIVPHQVALDPAGAGRIAVQREAATDAAGRFSVGGLPPGDYRVVVVQRNGEQNFAELLGVAGRAQGAAPRLIAVAEGATVDAGDV